MEKARETKGWAAGCSRLCAAGFLGTYASGAEAVAEREPSRMRRWAKWGMIAGWALSMLYINAWSPAQLGFYIGPVPMPLVFAVFIGGGALIGAGCAWLQDKLPPPDDGLRS